MRFLLHPNYAWSFYVTFIQCTCDTFPKSKPYQMWGSFSDSIFNLLYGGFVSFRIRSSVACNRGFSKYEMFFGL